MHRKALLTYYTGEIVRLPFKGVARKRHMKGGLRIKPRHRLRYKRRNRDRKKKRVAYRGRRRRRSRKFLGSNRLIDINHYSERKHLGAMSRLTYLDRGHLVGKRPVKARRHTRYVYRSRADLGTSFAPLDRLLVRRRQQYARTFNSTKSLALSLPRVTASALSRFTPKGTAGRVRRLYRVARYSRDLLRGLRAGRERRQYRRKRKVRASAVASYLRRAAHYFGRRFVEQVGETSPVAPLVFQRPTIRLVKTEQTKQREFAASVAERENRFRFTAQYLESITQYIPALMSQMFSNRIKNNKLPPVAYHSARYLVRNIY